MFVDPVNAVSIESVNFPSKFTSGRFVFVFTKLLELSSDILDHTLSTSEIDPVDNPVFGRLVNKPLNVDPSEFSFVVDPVDNVAGSSLHFCSASDFKFSILATQSASLL